MPLFEIVFMGGENFLFGLKCHFNIKYKNRFIDIETF